MESPIRIVTQEDAEHLARLLTNAYPSPRGETAESVASYAAHLREQLSGDMPNPFYGIYSSGTLAGAVQLHAFSAKLRSSELAVGGIGSVCVDLLHKKQRLAFELMRYACRHFRERGIRMAALYPFNPAFYRRMGFGIGTVAHLYRFHPAAFPSGGKAHVRYLTAADAGAALDCYSRYRERTPGLFARTEADCRGLFHLPNRVVGVERDGIVSGYAAFRFRRPDDIAGYDIVVSELVYDDPQALRELLAFFHSQSDQVERIEVQSGDEHLHMLLDDPSSGRKHRYGTGILELRSTGIGLMYRVLDVRQVWEPLSGWSFGDRSCRVEFRIADSLVVDNERPFVLRVQDGRAEVADEGEADVAVSLDIARFSSLLAGSTDFATLYRYGLAELSDPSYLQTLQILFGTFAKPQCMTNF